MLHMGGCNSHFGPIWEGAYSKFLMWEGAYNIASNQNGGCILNGLTIRRVQFVLEINIEGCQSGV